jgi:hypothetical protein
MRIMTKPSPQLSTWEKRHHRHHLATVQHWCVGLLAGAQIALWG